MVRDDAPPFGVPEQPAAVMRREQPASTRMEVGAVALANASDRHQESMPSDRGQELVNAEPLEAIGQRLYQIGNAY